MNMIVQCGVLFGFLALGELVVTYTGISVPSSIIGMLLLTVALKIGVIKLRYVERMANFLIHNLGFFFVPAGIGLMGCLDILSDQWLPIIGAVVGSTLVIIAVTGHMHEITRKMVRRRSSGKLSGPEEG